MGEGVERGTLTHQDVKDHQDIKQYPPIAEEPKNNDELPESSSDVKSEDNSIREAKTEENAIVIQEPIQQSTTDSQRPRTLPKESNDSDSDADSESELGSSSSTSAQKKDDISEKPEVIDMASEQLKIGNTVIEAANLAKNLSSNVSLDGPITECGNSLQLHKEQVVTLDDLEQALPEAEKNIRHLATEISEALDDFSKKYSGSSTNKSRFKSPSGKRKEDPPLNKLFDLINLLDKSLKNNNSVSIDHNQGEKLNHNDVINYIKQAKDMLDKVCEPLQDSLKTSS